MRANPAYLGFDGICRRFEIIISATERVLAVASIIICRMEKTVSLTDFIPDARGIMSAKPSRITGETEIIIGEASINPSGLEMIETIAGFIDGPLFAVAFVTRSLQTVAFGRLVSISASGYEGGNLPDLCQWTLVVHHKAKP